MTSPEENRNIEVIRNRSPKIGRIIVAIILIGVLAFFVKSHFGNDAQPGQQEQAQQQQPQAPSVVLHVIANADLAASREYIGRVEPIQTVSVRPQVAGEISQVHFKEGSIVKAGQLLFTLDSKEYQATVDLRKADLAKVQADYDRALKYYNRLKSSDRRSVSASDLDTAESETLQARAAIDQAKASLRLAQINLGYTKITAPITGQIGKAEFTKGNYVTSAGGALTSIVQVDPIRVSFALPDKDYLEQLEAFKASNSSVYNATIRLADGSSYPFSGQRDFENNMMDAQTGTMTMRLRFKNDKGLLIPGAMVRVLTRPVKSHVTPIIPQEAILADSQGDFAYVIDENNIAHQRRITLGAEIGTMREVLSGLTAGDKVIRSGLQSVRPEMPVNPAPLRDQDEEKTPAERAMESGYDLHPASDDSTSGAQQESTEGKN